MRIEHDGVGLHVRTDGDPDAPALLLSNSLGADLEMWAPQVGAFARRFRVVRYDTRGHGRSDAPRGPYTIADLGGDVVAVLDALGVERAHVCGISLGGLTALWLAAASPDRVDRLVCADTAARVGDHAGWQERIDTVRRDGVASIRDLVLERFFSERARREQPEMVAAAGDTLAATDDEGYAGACAALRDADLRDVVGTIEAPALVVVGDQDVATPPADARRLVDALPSARLAVIEGAGHLANLERPEVFTSRVLGFLAADDESPRGLRDGSSRVARGGTDVPPRPPSDP